ncbi:MAG: hypothetical protein NZL96_02170 [Patescibacteria group bacterium]|nr:hypothetical protein [Patescibacteria group bacterium]
MENTNFNQIAEELINNLTERLIARLVDGSVEREASKEIALFILEEKEKIVSLSDLEKFLDSIEKKYYFVFFDLVDLYRRKIKIQKEEEMNLKEVKDKLLNLASPEKNVKRS